MKLIIDLDQETYKNARFYGTFLNPRDKWNLEQALKNATKLEGLPKEKWVSCSERLPETDGYYLTTTMYKEVYCDYWSGVNFDRTEMVVAWMELPQPYRGDTK